MLDLAERVAAKRVLVVDDKPIDKQMLIDKLGVVYQIEEASDGESAINRLRSASLPAIDLVLLDLKLPPRPHMADTFEEGYRVVESIMKLPLHPEVIVISAYPLAELEGHLKELGIRYVLPKMATVERLRAMVAEALKAAA